MNFSITPSKYVCPNDAEYPLLPKYDSSFDQSHLLFAPRDVTSTPSTNNLILFIVSYKISIWYKTPTSVLKLKIGASWSVLPIVAIKLVLLLYVPNPAFVVLSPKIIWLYVTFVLNF